MLHNVKVKTIDKISKNLDIAKPSGLDQISAKFLKGGAPVIVIHLAKIRILPIKLDTFPFKCKIVKIKSLFKKRIKTKGKTYRLVSLLVLISKVIEKSIHNQAQDYLQKNKLFYIYQSGFRANHFTDTCLSQSTNMILNRIKTR